MTVSKYYEHLKCSKFTQMDALNDSVENRYLTMAQAIRLMCKLIYTAPKMKPKDILDSVSSYLEEKY